MEYIISDRDAERARILGMTPEQFLEYEATVSQVIAEKSVGELDRSRHPPHPGRNL